MFDTWHPQHLPLDFHRRPCCPAHCPCSRSRPILTLAPQRRHPHPRPSTLTPTPSPLNAAPALSPSLQTRGGQVGGILGASIVIIYFCLQLTGDISDRIDGDKGWYSKIICSPLPASLSTADAVPPFAALQHTFSNVSRRRRRAIHERQLPPLPLWLCVASSLSRRRMPRLTPTRSSRSIWACALSLRVWIRRPSMPRSRAVMVVAASTCGCLLRAVDEVAGLVGTKKRFGCVMTNASS